MATFEKPSIPFIRMVPGDHVTYELFGGRRTVSGKYRGYKDGDILLENKSLGVFRVQLCDISTITIECNGD